MQPKKLEFRFKGDRDYIHGTDMFNAIFGVYPNTTLRNVHFTIHGFVRTPRCEVYEVDSPELLRSLNDIKVRASFGLNGIAQWVALRESYAPGPAGRYEYPEDRVVSLCEIQDHGIVLKGESPYTFIETVVTMNKHMHQGLFSDAMGKWIFTGIDLGHPCDARQNISLQIGRDANYRLTRAKILHNDQAVGNLFFSLAKQ